MVDRLRVTDLDFDAIKTNLKAFLKQQTEFQDYDFDGAGLSILLDILAYNTHYNAYYLNMVANESFLDTALLRDSVVSHAKTLGYTPYSTRAPVAIIDLTLESNNTTSGTCTLPEGFAFLSNQIDNKAYNFVVLEDTTVTKSNTQYVFENLQIYEGQLITYSFTYDEGSNPKSIFQLSDPGIDTTTIKVTVTPNAANTLSSVYQKVTEILDVSATSEVYFLQEGRGGLYEIYFGNDVVGKKLPDGAIVSVTYLVTNGVAANKANNFVPTATVTDSLGVSLTNFAITPKSAASGGSIRETVENIKLSAAARFSSQNRLVTYKDYETYILNNYPNIDSISVWGGEENDPPIYGKVFVSMKPKANYYISETEKQRIIDEIITPKSIVAVQTQILDPDYLYILLENKVSYNPKKTINTEEILRNAIRNSLLLYRDDNLNKFNTRFVLSKAQDSIDAVDFNSIIGSECIVRVQKRFKPTLNETQTYTLNFNVPLHRGTVSNKLTSTKFDVIDSFGARQTVFFDEIPQSFSGISSVEVVNPGTNYTSSPTVTIVGDGIGATATATIVNGGVQNITITNRGINYTQATVTISGGGGYGAEASAIIDAKTGTLRTIYYDSNAQRQTVNENAGEIDYETGTIIINAIKIISVASSDETIRMTIESDSGIIESVRNTILTLDDADPSSIVTTFEAI